MAYDQQLADVLADNERLRAEKIELLRGSTGDIKVLVHLRQKVASLEQQVAELRGAALALLAACHSASEVAHSFQREDGDLKEYNWARKVAVGLDSAIRETEPVTDPIIYGKKSQRADIEG